ncbi:hypothetical protein AB0I93_08090 [Streptomyces sp. NPDC049967]|uniref:hypothetical protein n=1 Tax=unclassified Streptomyces TaxID=2593676 RepID=UPI002E2BFA13|nr:hypothetical protein [Streptomyces sp. NBC_00342]
MPAPSITITAEPSGSVSAKGASDDLSATLLKHAGFQQIEDWYGRRHRLPTTTPVVDRAAIATHAAEMLRAARYGVNLDPSLDTAQTATPADPLGSYPVGAELLQLTDQIRSAKNGADLQRAVNHLLHPEHGALERVREALEAAGEQINDLDDEAYALAYHFDFATESVSLAQSELAYLEAELRRVGNAEQSQAETPHSPMLPDRRDAALAPSPAAAKAKVSSAFGGGASDASAAVRPSQAPGPRAR